MNCSPLIAQKVAILATSCVAKDELDKRHSQREHYLTLYWLWNITANIGIHPQSYFLVIGRLVVGLKQNKKYGLPPVCLSYGRSEWASDFQPGVIRFVVADVALKTATPPHEGPIHACTEAPGTGVPIYGWSVLPV